MVSCPYTLPQFIYNEPNVQFANTLAMSNVNSYFAGTMKSYVDVARYDTISHTALVSNYSNGPNYANYNYNLICNSHSQIICVL
jgi:ribosomal protein S26